MMKQSIPIGPLAADEHASNSVPPVDIQQMIKQTLDFFEELDRDTTRLILEDLNETKQQNNNLDL